MKALIKSIIGRGFCCIFALGMPELFAEYKKLINLQIIKEKWRGSNKHNYTVVGNKVDDPLFPIEKVKVGNFTYGALEVFSFGSNDESLLIGSFCSIAPKVKFIIGGMHYTNHISTYPFKAYFFNESEAFSKGPIIVEDDVWIGTEAIILSGVTISKGTVIAARSVVTKSTLPYSVVGGNPAKIIKYRFSEELIENLHKVNYSLLTSDFIKSNIDLFYMELDNNGLLEFLTKYETNEFR